jgi:hypothetical protein
MILVKKAILCRYESSAFYDDIRSLIPKKVENPPFSRVLVGLDGVYQADASVEGESVVARYNSNRVIPTQIRVEIEKVGYSAGDPVTR